jgi:cellulose biosynthesis protein BcsQ
MSGYHDDLDQNDYKPQGLDVAPPAMGCFSCSGTSEGALYARRDRYYGIVRRVRAHLRSRGAVDAQIDRTTRSVGMRPERQPHRPSSPVVTSDLQEALQRLGGVGFELAIIDTPGTDAHSTRIAMAAADLCLIPLRPSKADLNATIPTIAALRDMRRRFAFVLNQAPPNKQARLTLAVSKRLETDAPIAPVALAARLDNQYAYALGQGVTEYAPTSRAAEEIRELWQWCCKQMRIGHDQEQKRSA